MSGTPPQDLSDSAVDPHLGVLPPDELEPPGADISQRGVPVPPAIPAVPGLGGTVPGAGAVPVGGIPGGLPPAGLLHGLQRVSSPAQLGDEPLDPDGDRIATDDAPSGESAEEDDDAADTSPGSGPTTATLPDGETVTAATPQLAAVIQAAAGGTPIAEAFRQQGITIPPPGSAVPGPVDPSRVSPGDIGMFTDRYALAAGNSKALLDGQIQQITNVGGPSFLGWQHPPMVGETAAPAPTRLSATLRT